MSTATPPAAKPTTTRAMSLDDLFAEQQTMTAVETFSRVHDDTTREPDQARYYKSLIPATPPSPGQQYSFEVDLDSCSGCKACVVACHSLNGLDNNEAWREVGLLHGAKNSQPLAELPVLQHVTTACHHCVEPGCLQGCPVNAYEKDPVTGIVKHLDDQCFGCQYCTLMCPYEVPKYHAEHGIVRKCDMCSDRLAAGEAPACVQACPHEAIKIRTVSAAAVRVDSAKSDVCKKFPRGHFCIPNSPKLTHTFPTTVYRSKKLNLSAMEPVDLRTPQPAHAHLPLTAMLTLTQIGVGGFFAAAVAALFGLLPTSPAMMALTFVAFLVVNAGLGLATLHLGRPHLGFRAVLGWRHSWLSREMIAFGAFMPIAATATMLSWSAYALNMLGMTTLQATLAPWLPVLFAIVATTAAVAGVGAVFTSAMIYIACRKSLWSFSRTITRFTLTTFIGAASLLLAAVLLFENGETISPTTVCMALVGLVAAKLLFDRAPLSLAGNDRSDPLVRSAVLLVGPLGKAMTLRTSLSTAGMAVSLVSLVWAPFIIPAVALLISGELVERWLFFTAATGPRMPGQIQPGQTIAAVHAGGPA